MNYLDQVSNVAVMMITIIGVLAAMTSIIVEVLKAVPLINKLPTKLVVFLVSMIMTPIVMVGYMSWQGKPIEWFMVFASFIAAFVIALVSMSGWQAVAEIMQRCIRKK